MSAFTSAPVTVPEFTVVGVFAADDSVGIAAFSRARTRRGAPGATSFSAPLLVETTGLSGALVAVAGGGFGSLMRWGC